MREHKRRPPEGFCERLAEAFYESGKSASAIEREIGVNHSNLLSYITGDMAPTVINLAKLCKVLKVSADYLLFGKEV